MALTSFSPVFQALMWILSLLITARAFADGRSGKVYGIINRNTHTVNIHIHVHVHTWLYSILGEREMVQCVIQMCVSTITC